MMDGTPTKWEVAKLAMSNMLNKYSSFLDFGWDVFPNNGMCGVNQPAIVDCAPNNGQNIIGRMNARGEPMGSTPLFCAMSKFKEPGYAKVFTSPDATPYLLVVSDGSDVCGVRCGGLIPTPATAVQLGTVTDELCKKGINTYAIGFGEGASPAQLNAIARNGCTGRKQYIVANNQQELEKALNDIAATAVSCVYELNEVDDDADPNETNFYFDDDVVGYDEDCAKEKGWTWTDDTQSKVEFCKEACEILKGGTIHNIRATFGCPVVPVE
ncbi:MAG: VWA domain-containing protein [Proteobacteria bacterium]|nr:VWA domain-containing protein [Pseudomonadota bacterium]